MHFRTISQTKRNGENNHNIGREQFDRSRSDKSRQERRLRRFRVPLSPALSARLQRVLAHDQESRGSGRLDAANFLTNLSKARNLSWRIWFFNVAAQSDGECRFDEDSPQQNCRSSVRRFRASLLKWRRSDGTRFFRQFDAKRRRQAESHAGDSNVAFRLQADFLSVRHFRIPTQRNSGTSGLFDRLL